MAGPISTTFARLQPHRARLAQGLLLIAVVVFVLQAEKAVPRETQISFDLGAVHGRVQGLALAYLEDGGLHQSARFRFSKGAPAQVRHRVELLPGRYSVRCELTLDDGSQHMKVVALEVPAAGVVRFDLSAK